MIKVRVKGLDKATGKILPAVEKFVARVSQDTIAEAKRITPVRSGRAKRSWTKTKVGKYSFDISNKVSYSGRLDAGYSKQAPKGITRPTTKAVARKYK